MASKTYKDSPKIREQWEEWMRPWTYCPGCATSWPDYATDTERIPCTCTEEEEE